jgi:hypothetical protein
VTSEQLIEILREIDGRLTAGGASAEISAREQRRGDQILMLETELHLNPGTRTLAIALLQRQRIKVWPKPRSRRGIVVISTPAVFLQEVLLKELEILERAVVEYLERSAEEIAFKSLGVRMGEIVPPSDG